MLTARSRKASLALAVAVTYVAAAMSAPADGLASGGVRASVIAAGRHAKCAKRSHRRNAGRRLRRRFCARPSRAHEADAGFHQHAAGVSTEEALTQTAAVQPAEGTLEPAAKTDGAFRFFSSSSPWNTPLESSSPLDPGSAELMEAFDAEIREELQLKRGPWISTTSYSVPIYTVSADQPTVPVQLASKFSVPALRSAFSAVPLPPDAHPAAGTDGHLVVWQPSNDRLWEFWRLVQTPEGWQASWGGAMQDASSNSGVYGPEAWPGATSSWGASASALSIAGGLITFEDLERGKIDHALALGIPNVRAGAYAAPAQRTDGKSLAPMSLPEGAHLRLDPQLDLTSLNLPRLTLMIAKAMQRYGAFVRDGAGDVTFYAQDPTPLGTNPYSSPKGYFEGESPMQLLSSFPWAHLQLLNMPLSSSMQ